MNSELQNQAVRKMNQISIIAELPTYTELLAAVIGAATNDPGIAYAHERILKELAENGFTYADYSQWLHDRAAAGKRGEIVEERSW